MEKHHKDNNIDYTNVDLAINKILTIYMNNLDLACRMLASTLPQVPKDEFQKALEISQNYGNREECKELVSQVKDCLETLREENSVEEKKTFTECVIATIYLKSHPLDLENGKLA